MMGVAVGAAKDAASLSEVPAPQPIAVTIVF